MHFLHLAPSEIKILSTENPVPICKKMEQGCPTATKKALERYPGENSDAMVAAPKANKSTTTSKITSKVILTAQTALKVVSDA